MLKAIIFDMDGVLIDSTKCNWESFRELLKGEDVHFSDDYIRKNLGRSLRDQLNAWKQDFGIGDYDPLEFSKKAGEAIAFLNAKIEEGMDPQEFTKNLVRYLRQALLIKINPSLKDMLSVGFTKEQLTTMEKQAGTVKEGELAEIVDRFSSAENKMKYASIVQLPLELAIIESCGIV